MIINIAAIIFILVILVLIIFPIETISLKSKPRAITDYETSVSLVEKFIATDPENIADYGHAILMTHGRKTKRVVVMYHGFTNCPRQYEMLAKKFFDQGYNVYVPRIPHHGIGDRYTKEIGKLTIKDLIKVCDTSIDVAHGLGENVTVLGLSMGGVMASWNAQFRDDVDNAFILVPSFGWYFLPGIVRMLINLSFLLPNSFLWWDPIKKDNRDCPYSMYHYFSTHGMGHIWRMGLSVLRDSRKQPPLAKRIVVMT
ncbi:MAG: hypothetical protein GY861_11650, partial [bacterium]|nr:hypothetical protein [bacterium]